MKVVIFLEREEERALIKAALKEKRDTSQQAAFIIRQWLEDTGLLPIPQLSRVSVEL